MTPPGPRVELLVLGASLGGLRALQCVLGALPAGYRLPVLVVQHRVRDNDALASVLQTGVALAVADAEDKQAIEPGRVLLAPPDYHLLVEPGGSLALSLDAAVSHARPSIDVLFESAAEVYGPRVVGVALTGANADGAAGLAWIKAMGGFAIIEDPNTAEAPALPRAALARVPDADRVMPVEKIAEFLARL